MKILDAVTQANSLRELNRLVKQATPNISFWGERFVTVKGYEGKLNIHEFGVRASELYNRDNKDDQQKAPKLSKRLVQMYNTVRELEKHSNPLTHILCRIRIWHSQREGYGSPEFDKECYPESIIFRHGYKRPYLWV